LRGSKKKQSYREAGQQRKPKIINHGWTLINTDKRKGKIGENNFPLASASGRDPGFFFLYNP